MTAFTVGLPAGPGQRFAPGAFDHKVGHHVIVKSGDIFAGGMIGQATVQRAVVADDGRSVELTADLPADFPAGSPVTAHDFG